MTGYRPPIRVVVGRRLVYYADPADHLYWVEHWSSLESDEIYRNAQNGDLGMYLRPFTRYLPRSGMILEAGCGLGQYVLALRTRGYEVLGVDTASDTIKSARERYRDLPLAINDARAICADNGSFIGYISLGVVEHLESGPEPFLREAYRVLEPGGIALFTVPSFNLLRWAKWKLGWFRGVISEDILVYQYAFQKEEFAELVGSAGFRILEVTGFDCYKTLADELPWVRRLLDRKMGRYHLGSVTQVMLAKISPLENLFGHMLMFVCIKPGARIAGGRLLESPMDVAST